MTEKGVVRDLITTAADQRELYQQLVRNGMIKRPSLTRQVYSHSVFCYRQSRAAAQLSKETQSLAKKSWSWYERQANAIAERLHSFNAEAARDEADANHASEPSLAKADPLLDLLESFKRRLEESSGKDGASPSRPVRPLGGLAGGSARLLTTEDMDSFMKSTFGFRPQAQTEQETRQLMSLFNEQDDEEGEPLDSDDWTLGAGAKPAAGQGQSSDEEAASRRKQRAQNVLGCQENRGRLVSDDIFKEIDEQVYADHCKQAQDRVAAESSKAARRDPASRNRAELAEGLPSPPAEAEERGRPKEPETNEAEEESSEEEEDYKDAEVEDRGGLRLGRFSDKHLQKLQRVSEQQIERVRLISQTAEKST